MQKNILTARDFESPHRLDRVLKHNAVITGHDIETTISHRKSADLTKRFMDMNREVLEEGRKERASIHMRRIRQKSKMFWPNLLEAKCPQCGGYLKKEKAVSNFVCDKGCGFRIGILKCAEIKRKMKEEDLLKQKNDIKRITNK
jgi:hypothetical protein